MPYGMSLFDLLFPKRKAKRLAAFRNSDRSARLIVDLEARRDKAGNVIAYTLPANDGGAGNGLNYEFAGINGRYHPEAVRKLTTMRAEDREAFCVAYIEDYTRKGTKIERGTLRAGTDFLILDCTWNRGPGGAAWIAQWALRQMGFDIPLGAPFGPLTRELTGKADAQRPEAFIAAITAGRERYERERVGYRANLWAGLENRWRKAWQFAADLNEQESRL